MKKITATILGFAGAPIIPAIYGAFTTPIARDFEMLRQVPLVLMFYVFALPFIVVFGVPAFLLARYLRLVRWWSAVAVGITIGAIVAILVAIQGTIDIQDFIIFCPLGGASGLTFWLIWKQGRETSENDNVKTR